MRLSVALPQLRLLLTPPPPPPPLSKLVFADNLVGISETPEGLQKQIAKAVMCMKIYGIVVSLSFIFPHPLEDAKKKGSRTH